VAIAAFFSLGLTTLAVLWPTSWKFEADPRDIISEYIESEDALALPLIQRDLALHRADVLEENGKRLKSLIRLFRAAGVLLIVEIVAWAIDLAIHVD
jgi:hypothetical protein